MVHSGEFDSRVDLLRGMLAPCRLCPRRCGVDRSRGETGVCGTSGAVVSAATAHFGEEPGISGPGGSGTIFFAGCNLRCCYCQNHEISQGLASGGADERGGDAGGIARTMLRLQERGCCNINLVTPSHVAAQAVHALSIATGSGLSLPVVWNTSSYESVETLRQLEGIVDVWLADLRYSDRFAADECSGAADYVEVSRAALQEMARQTGSGLTTDASGVVTGGMIIRLLVLPNDMAGVRESLDYIADSLGTKVRVSLMSQYFPSHRSLENPLLARRVTEAEYARVVEHAARLGFADAFVQEFEAQDFYRPDFTGGDEPFVDARLFSEVQLPENKG